MIDIPQSETKFKKFDNFAEKTEDNIMVLGTKIHEIQKFMIEFESFKKDLNDVLLNHKESIKQLEKLLVESSENDKIIVNPEKNEDAK